MLKRVSYFVITIVLFLGFGFNVNAKNNHTIDFERKGSIEIVLHEYENDTYVEGAEITLYRIADAYKNGIRLSFKYTEDFSDCDISLDKLDKDGLSEEIGKCIKEDSVGLVEITNEDGFVKFEELPLGLYLVKQTNKVDGYSVIEPFLIHIPTTIDNSWTYELEAEPKTEIIRLMDVIVEKKWDIQNSRNTPKSIVIELLKNGEVIDEITLNNENNWTHTWVQIIESDEYSVREKVVPEGYTVTYRQEGNKFIVTNIRTLVNTGQNNIISIILGSLGLILVIVGVIYDKRKKYE